jgi:hypothetical protein
LGHGKQHLPAIQIFTAVRIDTNFDPPQFPLDSTFKEHGGIQVHILQKRKTGHE